MHKLIMCIKNRCLETFLLSRRRTRTLSIIVYSRKMCVSDTFGNSYSPCDLSSDRCGLYDIPHLFSIIPQIKILIENGMKWPRLVGTTTATADKTFTSRPPQRGSV